jgi:cobalt-precorrin-6B (C15)-methyltransferase
MWKHRTPGIPDESFERVEDVPITKEEVRVIQISKARLSSGQTVYDVGCGSGSISIEAANQVGSSGKVFSIDIDQNAVELTKKNLDKFQISKVSVILGNATQKISELPVADAIFIGGTGGETAEIVKLCESKLKQGGRIVIVTILVETLY